jgi:hypothetical protein
MAPVRRMVDYVLYGFPLAYQTTNGRAIPISGIKRMALPDTNGLRVVASGHAVAYGNPQKNGARSRSLFQEFFYTHTH